MGGDVDDTKVRERGDTHCARCVSKEVEEGGAEGAQESIGQHPVAQGGHRVLADSEADVAAFR
eukprot:scaffold279618_cov28-Tisochrysis_lutea.AAC.2